MSRTKTAVATGMQRERLFPIARVSRVPLRVGMEYAETTIGKPMEVPSVTIPVRSSLAQRLLIHRPHLSRYFTRLRTYGFAPGNPVLRAHSTPLKSRQTAAVSTPQMTRFGQTPIPGGFVFPRTASPGTLRAVRRFPKAIPVNPNNYKPPIYGGQESAQNA